MLKVYTYKNCDTCRKAVKWLQAQGLAYGELAIRETPPTVKELRVMLAAYEGELRRLFNTSGGDYKAMSLKDALPGMSEAKAITLLSENGNLVKRPFLIGDGAALVGFKESEWSAALMK